MGGHGLSVVFLGRGRCQASFWVRSLHYQFGSSSPEEFVPLYAVAVLWTAGVLRIMANIIGEVVLIYYGEKPAFFARIDSIEPDKKKDWFRVQLLVLTVPLRTITWILREEYINGVPFTMEGNPVRIQAVNPVRTGSDSEDTAAKGTTEKVASREGRKIIPFRKIEKGDTKGA